jgi:outer membrane receptor protein involved in Fe transport
MICRRSVIITDRHVRPYLENGRVMVGSATFTNPQDEPGPRVRAARAVPTEMGIFVPESLRRNLLLPVLCVLCRAAALRPALAEEAAGPASSGVVEHVQVITTHLPEKTETTPASVTVFTREDLLRRGAFDLRSALLVVAGVDIAPGGDGGPAASVPEFWGLKEFDAFLLTVDGVPWGGAFNPSLQTLDLQDVDRIEVLRGAAPVTYGATSFVGVINVVHGAPGEGGSTVRASGGSYGSGSVAWSTPLPGWAGVRSSLSLDASKQGFSDDRAGFDRGHLRWMNGRSAGPGTVRFNLDGLWQRQDPGSPIPREGEDLSSSVPVDSNQNPMGSHIDDQKYTVDTTYERPVGASTWSTIVSLSHSRQEILRGFLVDVVTPPDNAHGFRQTIPILDAYLDSHFVLHRGTGVEVITGFDHLHSRGTADGGDFDYSVNLDGSGVPSGGDLPSQADVGSDDRREFSGLYGQLVWTPRDTMRVEAGARINRAFETRSIDSLEFTTSTRTTGGDQSTVVRGSGFAGLTWTAWRGGADDLRLFANYRNTFKPAAFDFGLDAEAEILAPETAVSYEGGLKSVVFGSRLYLELSAFHMDMKNTVVSEDVGGVPVLVNGGEQRFRGLELSADLKVAPDLEWRVVSSLHDARFTDFVTDFGSGPTQLAGNRIEMSARTMTGTEIVFGHLEKWHGLVRGTWVGSRFLDKRNTALAPAYFTWSAGVGCVVHEVELRLDALNLNDVRPPVSESELGDAQYYLLPSRSVVLSARWTPGPSGR